MSIKQQFPDEVALQQFLRSNIDSFVQQVKVEVGPLEAEYLEKSKQRKQGILLIVTVVVAAFLVLPASASFFEVVSSTAIFIWAFILSCLLSVGALSWLVWKKLKGATATIQAFHTAVNNSVYPLAFEMFGLTATRTAETMKDSDSVLKQKKVSFWSSVIKLNRTTQQAPISPGRDNAMSLLDHSELITEPRNQVTIDDMVTASLNDQTLFLFELKVQHVTGSGEDKRTNHIFHGYFVSLELERALTGKTFVSTEGDKSGFGHQSFFTTKKNKGLEKTELEWNDFEKLLHVVTSDPIEARYILTPNFMLDLHDWWTNQKQNIRVSFVDNKMYMLFPDKNIRIGKTVKRIDAKQIQKYLESVSIPLLHVLHLVEDVKQ
jgi:hypothetical protein